MIETKGTYRQLSYCVLFDTEFGYRCGYVGIPKDFKIYQQHYEDLSDIECHGGLTFSRFCDNLGPDLWWIGYDCNHNDGVDIKCLEEYAGKDVAERRKNMYDYEYKTHCHIYTLEECVEICKSIINQIYKYELKGDYIR